MFSPSDIGTFHNEILTKLSKDFSKRKGKNTATLKDDFINILSSYCDKGDTQCIEEIYQIEEQAQYHMSSQDPFSGRIQVIYPDGMDPPLKTALKEIFSILDLLNEENLDEIVTSINAIEEQIHDLSRVTVSYRKMALSAAAVARESTKFWHSVYFDERNPFYGLVQSSERKLQQTLPPIWTLPFIIGADVLGAVLVPYSMYGCSILIVGFQVAFPFNFLLVQGCEWFPISPFCWTLDVLNISMTLFSLPPAFSRIAFETVASML